MEYQLATDGLPGRLYVSGFGAQALPVWLQEILLPDTADIDIKNCAFTLVVQMIDNMVLDPAVLASVKPEMDVLREVAYTRGETTRQELSMAMNEWKELLLEVFNGSKIPDDLANNEFLKTLSSAGRFCRFLAMSQLPDTFAMVKANKAKDFPEATVMA